MYLHCNHGYGKCSESSPSACLGPWTGCPRPGSSPRSTGTPAQRYIEHRDSPTECRRTLCRIPECRILNPEILKPEWDWMPNSWTKNGTECRKRLNAETLYAELDLMPKFCMLNWTRCRITECRNLECRNLECRIGLNAKISNTELDWMHKWWISMYRWRCTGGGVTISGIGRVRSIHGGYPCTGGDVRSACTVKRRWTAGRSMCALPWMFCSTSPLKILPSGPFGIQSNSVLGISALEISAFSPVRYSKIILLSVTFGRQSNSAFEISVLSPIRHSKIWHSVEFGIGEFGIWDFGIKSHSAIKNSVFSPIRY